MISQDAQKLAALIRAQFGLHDLLPHLVRLLAAAGEPVTVEHAAETGGWTVEQVRAELARHPGVDWDADGRIVRFGATLRPTPHRSTG
jgi:alkylmercury lyase